MKERLTHRWKFVLTEVVASIGLWWVALHGYSGNFLLWFIFVICGIVYGLSHYLEGRYVEREMRKAVKND